MKLTVFCMQDEMDGIDYTALLLVHLLDNNDVVNAKFLFQRVPDHIKKRSQSFGKVWTAVKALAHGQSGDALVLLRDQLQVSAASTNPMKDVIEPLRQLVSWHLSEHTVPNLIADTYSNIEMVRAKEMLSNPANFDQIAQKTSLLASARADAKGFVEVQPRQVKDETFAIDQKRVDSMVKIVQFLERQKYDVTDSANQMIAAEEAEDAKKRSGKVAAK